MSSLRDFQRNLATFCYHNVVPTGLQTCHPYGIFPHLSIYLMSAGSYGKRLLRFRSQIRLSLITNHSSPIFPTSLSLSILRPLKYIDLPSFQNLASRSSFSLFVSVSNTGFKIFRYAPAFESYTLISLIAYRLLS